MMGTDVPTFHAAIILCVPGDVLPIYFPYMVHWMLQIRDASLALSNLVKNYARNSRKDTGWI